MICRMNISMSICVAHRTSRHFGTFLLDIAVGVQEMLQIRGLIDVFSGILWRSILRSVQFVIFIRVLDLIE